MPYPPATKDLHHEMELVAALGTGGADITEQEALAHVWGYGAGLDMTRRDLQGQAKKEGKPWDMGKGFDLSAPIGTLVAALAACPSTVSTTRCAGVAARLTSATGSSTRRPAAISRPAISSRCFKAM